VIWCLHITFSKEKT